MWTALFESNSEYLRAYPHTSLSLSPMQALSLSLALSLVVTVWCKPPAAPQRNSSFCVLRLLLLLLTTLQEFFQLWLRCCKSCFCISFALPGCEPLVFALLYWRVFCKSVEPPSSLFGFLASVTLMTTMHSKHFTHHSFWKKIYVFPTEFSEFLARIPTPWKWIWYRLLGLLICVFGNLKKYEDLNVFFFDCWWVCSSEEHCVNIGGHGEMGHCTSRRSRGHFHKYDWRKKEGGRGSIAWVSRHRCVCSWELSLCSWCGRESGECSAQYSLFQKL